MLLSSLASWHPLFSLFDMSAEEARNCPIFCREYAKRARNTTAIAGVLLLVWGWLWSCCLDNSRFYCRREYGACLVIAFCGAGRGAQFKIWKVLPEELQVIRIGFHIFYCPKVLSEKFVSLNTNPKTCTVHRRKVVWWRVVKNKETTWQPILGLNSNLYILHSVSETRCVPVTVN